MTGKSSQASIQHPHARMARARRRTKLRNLAIIAIGVLLATGFSVGMAFLPYA